MITYFCLVSLKGDKEQWLSLEGSNCPRSVFRLLSFSWKASDFNQFASKLKSGIKSRHGIQVDIRGTENKEAEVYSAFDGFLSKNLIMDQNKSINVP